MIEVLTMKKILCLLFSLLLIFSFSSCSGNQHNDEVSTTENSVTTTVTDTAEQTSEQLKTTNTIQTEITSRNTAAKTTVLSTEKTNESLNEVPPYILALNLREIEQIEAAAKSKSEDDFVLFMEENFSSEVMNGMTSVAETLRLINEVKSAYLILVDGKHNNEIMHFYTESHNVSYKIYITESLSIRYTSYTSGEQEAFFKESEHIRIINTYAGNNNAEIELFEYTTIEPNELFGNIRIGDEYMRFRMGTDTTVQDFENLLPRLTFVKLGNFLNETNTNITE